MNQPEQTLTAQTAQTVVVTSTWPWRGAEKRMVASLALLGLGIAVWGQGWWWTALPVGVASAWWLYQTGAGRKARSLVTATITADRISLRSRTQMGDSATVIDAVDHIGYRAFQSDRALLLRGDGTAARVPARLLDQEPVRAVVTRILDRAPSIDPSAREVLQEAGLL